jgi:hypothetical protein
VYADFLQAIEIAALGYSEQGKAICRGFLRPLTKESAVGEGRSPPKLASASNTFNTPEKSVTWIRQLMPRALFSKFAFISPSVLPILAIGIWPECKSFKVFPDGKTQE